MQSVRLIGPTGQVKFDALVDTGASFTLVPRSFLLRIGVRPDQTERFSYADGRLVEYELGSATARIGNREVATICIFGEEGAQPLLGAYTLEGLRLGVDPQRRQLVPVTGWLATAGESIESL